MNSSTDDWTGRIVLGHDWAVFAGRGGVTPIHQHLAFKWVFALEGETRVVSQSSVTDACNPVLVMPMEPHQVKATGAQVGLLFLQPALLARGSINRKPTCLERVSAAVRRFHDSGDFAPLESIVTECVDPSQPDEFSSIQNVLAEERGRLNELAGRLGLSPSRLSRAFDRHFGVTPALFRRWSCMRTALVAVAGGASLTEAAHASGFSDSSHMCRTLVEMIGITPGTFGASTLAVSKTSMQQLEPFPL